MGIFSSCCLTLIRIFLDFLAQIYYYVKYRNFVYQRLPPITNKLLLEPAIHLAAKIRSREITSREVVEVFIERIKYTNPFLNAVVEFRFDQALQEADEVDKHISAFSEDWKMIDELRKNKPFFGVPFTAKDSFGMKGLHQTGGLYARKDNISEVDAICIRMMQDSGAIIIGSTNVPELAFWWETSNVLYGTTNNPYSFNRSAGGSSGGECSIISAAGSPMGIGSDMGGSIRIPAYFNGIFGHKSSAGITNVAGYFPCAPETLQKFLVAGPLSRYAVDLRPMMKVLTIPEKLHLVNYERKISFKDIKIFYMEDDGGHPLTTPVNKEVKQALLKTVEHFRKVYNIPCEKLELPQVKRSVDIFLYKLLNDKSAPSLSLRLGNEKKEVNILWEIVKKCFCITGVHTTPILLTALATKLFCPRLLPSSYTKSVLKACDELEEKLSHILVDNAVFLYPTTPTVAIYHNESLFQTGNATYAGIFNIMGLPVTQCTLGLNTSGLPLGVQVVGGLYQDALCLTVAEEIERAFGGWVSPSDTKLA